MNRAGYPYRDPGPRYRLVQRAFSLFILVSLVSASLHLGQLLHFVAAGSAGLVEPGAVGTPAYDRVTLVTSVAYLVAFALCAVSFLAFKLQAARNLRALGARSLRYAPFWAVACYFVPVVNLVIPYRAMREILRGSAVSRMGDPRRTKSEPSPSSLLVVWWSLWLASAAMGILLLRNLQPEFAEEFAMAAGVHLLSDLADIALAVSVLRLLGVIAGRQAESARKRRHAACA